MWQAKKDERYAVIISNLDDSVDDEALFDTFFQFGTILNNKVIQTIGGPNGYGYIQFACAEDVSDVIENVHGMLIAGCQVSVEKYQ